MQAETKKYIFTTGSEGNLKQWDSNKHQLIKDYKNAHKGRITAMAADNSGQMLLTGDEFGTIKMWDITKQSCVHTFEDAHKDEVESMAIDKDGITFFSSGSYGHMRQWEINSKKILREFPHAHDCSIFSMVAGHESLYTCDAVGKMKEWNVKIGSCKIVPNKPTLTAMMAVCSTFNFGLVHPQGITACCISKNDDKLYTCDAGGYVKCWDLLERKIKHNFKSIFHGRATSLALIDNEKKLLVSSDLGTVKTLDLGTFTEVKKWGRVHDTEITSIISSPFDNLFWSTDETGNMKCWNTEDSQLINDYGKVHESVNSIAYCC